MASRISAARPLPNSFNPDPYVRSNSSHPAGYRAVNPDGGPGKLEAFSRAIEDKVERYSQPLKPHLPTIGRLLIVGTFFEDALRITTDWNNQLRYMQDTRHFPWGISHFFLLINILTMIIASTAVIAKRYTEFGVGSLFGIVILQGFGYGLIFDLNFFLRNLSVVGGLFMVFSDSIISRKSMFPGLPQITETDRRKYFLLAGRVLLIFLFLGFIIQGEWSITRAIISIVGLAACVMVAVGFKAKWSAAFLVLVLSVFNVFANNWWSVHSEHPQRDFLKYDFFQTLSIVGGLILLVNMGPGGISVDEKKKAF